MNWNRFILNYIRTSQQMRNNKIKEKTNKVEIYIMIFILNFEKKYWKMKSVLKDLSEVGFEPTPGEPDCDLNAAP